jgi:hypothetical protein
MLALCLMWFAPVPSHAHPAYLTVAEATIAADGRFRLTIRFDTLAFALNDTSARIGNEPMEELADGPRETLETALTNAKSRFLHGFRVITDRGPGRVESSEFPGAAQVLAWKATATPFLPVVLPVRLSGRLPAGAKSVAFRFPDILMQVILTVERPGEEPAAEAVEAGATSTPLSLAGAPPAKAPGTKPKPAASRLPPDRRRAYLLCSGVALLAMCWAAKRALSKTR